MTAIAWRHRPVRPPTPVVPRERVYGVVGPAVTVPPIQPIRSRPQQIIVDVAAEFGVDVHSMIHHRSRRTDAYILLDARSEAARRLRAIGLTTTKIGKFLHRDHSTVLAYLRGTW